MGFVRFSPDGSAARPGYHLGDDIIALDDHTIGPGSTDTPAYLSRLGSVASAVDTSTADAEVYEMAAVTLHTPVDRPTIIRLEGCHDRPGSDERNPHIESGGFHDRPQPGLWTAPASTLTAHEATVRLPSGVADFRPGVELAAVIGSPAADCSPDTVLEQVAGYTTAAPAASFADLPGVEGYKMFDTSTPIGPEVAPLDDEGLAAAAFELSVDGETLDETEPQWRFPLAELLAYASQVVSLEPGDIVLTGDPTHTEQALEAGQRVRAHIDGLAPLTVTVDREETYA